MRTLALVWLAGGSLAALPYLLNLVREVRSRPCTAGDVAFQVKHYGFRAWIAFWLWPVALPLLAFLLWRDVWTWPTPGPGDRRPLD